MDFFDAVHEHLAVPRCRVFARFAEIVSPAVTTPSLRDAIELIDAARVAVARKGRRKSKRGGNEEALSTREKIELLDRLQDFHVSLIDVYFDLAEFLQSRPEDADTTEVPITSCLTSDSLVRRLTRYEGDQPTHRVSCITLVSFCVEEPFGILAFRLETNAQILTVPCV